MGLAREICAITPAGKTQPAQLVLWDVELLAGLLLPHLDAIIDAIVYVVIEVLFAVRRGGALRGAFVGLTAHEAGKRAYESHVRIDQRFLHFVDDELLLCADFSVSLHKLIQHVQRQHLLFRRGDCFLQFAD